jgi:hypothetical protein
MHGAPKTKPEIHPALKATTKLKFICFVVTQSSLFSKKWYALQFDDKSNTGFTSVKYPHMGIFTNRITISC